MIADYLAQYAARRGLLCGLLLGCVLWLAACVPVNVPVPRAAETSDTAATVPATTPEATAEPSRAEAEEADLAELAAQLAELLPLRTGTSDTGFDGVQVQPVTSPVDMPPLWIAHPYGIRTFEPEVNHFVAIYTLDGTVWQELAQLSLECPDYLNENSVQQVPISPDAFWLAVEGGTGAHSGCFDLLRWDGDSFETVVSNFNSSPGAGSVEDLDSDGQVEVILNYTDPYVFCYACGVRLFMAEILRWNGEMLAPVELTPLATGSPEARAANDQAIALAQASLFPEALALIEEAFALEPGSPEIYWNAQWIRLHADQRLAFIDGGYPLLSTVFYGDYAAAVDFMRAYAPEQIFSTTSPLIIGTPAEGWIDALSQYLVSFASDAIDIRPDLAATYFLRGWGHFLAGAGEAAIADVQQAAALASDDSFYQEAAAFLAGESSAPLPPSEPEVTSGERVRFRMGATTELLGAVLQPGSERRYLLEIEAGQTLYVTAVEGVVPTLFNSEGIEVTGKLENGAHQFEIVNDDTFTLALTGDGMAYSLLYIPAQPDTTISPVPAITEEIRFAPGESSSALEIALQEGVPVGYILGIDANQRLLANVEGNGSFLLLDPEGRLVTPIAGWASNAEYVIPYAGSYTLVVQGSGNAALSIQIPPR